LHDEELRFVGSRSLENCPSDGIHCGSLQVYVALPRRTDRVDIREISSQYNSRSKLMLESELEL